VYTIISCVFAIAVTIPVVAYQTWKFIAPALTKEERKMTQRFIAGLFILFIVFWILFVISHCARIFNQYVSRAV
jgi:Sec-independent protein secretion pathway component TatC